MAIVSLSVFPLGAGNINAYTLLKPTNQRVPNRFVPGALITGGVLTGIRLSGVNGRRERRGAHEAGEKRRGAGELSILGSSH